MRSFRRTRVQRRSLRSHLDHSATAATNKDIDPKVGVELRRASVALGARRLGLALGAMLVLVGTAAVLFTTQPFPTALGPSGMILGGIRLITFGGSPPDLDDL